jgi:hypothetical protein
MRVVVQPRPPPTTKKKKKVELADVARQAAIAYPRSACQTWQPRQATRILRTAA